MSLQNYLTELSLPFDDKQLLKEFNNYHKDSMIPVYNSSTHTLDWYKDQDTWLFNKTPSYDENTEVKKLQLLVEDILGRNICGSPRFILQKADSNLPMHIDWETTASINIMLSDKAGPVEFKEYGDIFYKCALLNVKSMHRVPPYSEDRLILKIRMPDDMTYFECREKFNDYRRKG